MNWDVSIGHCKQLYGRLLQEIGRHTDRRELVLGGERAEFAGRLQARYGMLKHQVQWNIGLVRIPRQQTEIEATAERMRRGKRFPG